ncbi:MAG: hypothetical protein RLY16_1108 [Bacteroidota bacterium]|jgi:hypothetical protein
MDSRPIETIPFNIEIPFPLNATLFDALLSFPQFDLHARKNVEGGTEPVTDGEILFHMVIAEMQQKAVAFSSPGNSPKRNFIYWLNHHFITSHYPHNIEIKPKYFDCLYQLVKKVIIQSEPVKNIRQTPGYLTLLQVNGKEQLTEKGIQLVNEIFSI